MPGLGVLMLPITLLLSPAVSDDLLIIVLPGPLWYALCRLAWLWIAEPAGVIVAGALFGLSSMVT